MIKMKKKRNKKIIIIISSVVGSILILVLLFMFLLSPAGKSNKTINFEVKKGEKTQVIVGNLKSAGLIRSKYASLIYMILTNNKNLQAGSYELSKDMYATDIIKSINNGNIKEVKKPSVKITFKEGTTLKNYIKQISEETNIDYDEAIKKVNDASFLKGLIADYWFLTPDILNTLIYYPLEGYLFPNSYEFYKETTIEEVIKKILNETKKKLDPLKDQIENDKHSIHELLTIASIAEKEANSYDDRTKVTQVIYKRLDLNMALGMDVTSYYGVQKEMTETITKLDLNDKNPYNTRVTSFIGLPVGPICNPSIDSIKASLNPADTDYVYFVADVATGNVYFATDEKGFNELVTKYIK